MADIRDVVRSKLKRAGEQSQPPSVDDVQKVADHIAIVSKVTDTAAKLVGLDKLEKEKKEVEQKLEQTKAELEKEKMDALNKTLAEIKEALKKASEQQDIPAIKELEHKLEEARDTYHKEQLNSLHQEIAELRKPEKGAGDMAEEIKKIKEAALTLGLTSGVSTTPPDILLELKRMDIDLQTRLEEMKDERNRRDKEWELDKMKWQEERELRLSEAQQKYDIEKDRTETFKSTFERGVKIIGRAITEEGEAPAGIASASHVEAGEGEMGEFDCPKCHTPVTVAPDATRAVCAKCGFSVPIKRFKKVESEKQVG